MRRLPLLFASILALLAACSSPPPRKAATPSQPGARQPAPDTRSGAYYENDGPGANPPADLARRPDAVPRPEAPRKAVNQPYTVFGKTYVPAALPAGTRLTGQASWYGRKFHGNRTASGEIYDMYAMTAAHPTLPIPSYARVTNMQSGRSVVVRVNDRGPFLRERVIDLSYTAALKLGFAQQGSAWVEVEPIVFPAGARTASAPATAARPVAAAALATAAAPVTAPRLARPGPHFVQLGAFRSPLGAESFHRRTAAQLDWIGTLLHVAAENSGLLRVRAGPYGSADEAGAVALRITRETGLSPVLTRF